MCRNIIHTKPFVAGGRCTDRTSEQLNRRTLWCHQKEQRIYHLSLHHTFPFQVFCASVSMTRKWFKASAKQFQTSFSASNRTTLCHCKWGQRDVVYLSRCNLTCHRTVLIYIYAVSQTQLKHDQGLFPLWGAIKKERYFTCYPCRPQLQIFQEENFGGEPNVPWELQFTCHMQKGQTLKLICFPFTGTLGDYLPYAESLCGQASNCLLCPSATLVPAATSPLNCEPHHSLI